MRAFIVFLVCMVIMGAVVLGVGYSTCDQPPIKSGESSEATKPDKNKCSSPYSIFKVGLHELGVSVHDFHEEIIAVGTVFIAVFTIVLGLFTVSPAGSTDKLVSDAKEGSRRQLRAYVSSTPVHISSFDKDEMVIIKFKIENCGLTPARMVVHHADILVAPEPLPDDFVFPPVTAKLANPANVFPGKSFEGSAIAIKPFTPEERNTILDGSARIYCCGEIFYEDVFGTEDCRTNFCAGLVADSDTLKKLASGYRKADLKVAFQIARTGNSDT